MQQRGDAHGSVGVGDGDEGNDQALRVCARGRSDAIGIAENRAGESVVRQGNGVADQIYEVNALVLEA